MEKLYIFIDLLCKEYNIDESHNLQHSIRCIAWVQRLADVNNLTAQEQQIAVYAAALHDMCDAKYTDVFIGCERIREWLLANDWTEEFADVLIRIVTTMSYSKLKAAAADGQIVYPDHGRWQMVYHIVRHADLLEGYRVDRCYYYQKHIMPNISENDCWTKVVELFERRPLRYVAEGWIFLDAALEHTDRLEAEARRRIAMRDIYYYG